MSGELSGLEVSLTDEKLGTAFKVGLAFKNSAQGMNFP